MLCYTTNTARRWEEWGTFYRSQITCGSLTKRAGTSASFTAFVATPSSTAIDLVIMEIKLIKKSTGTVVYSQRTDVKYSSNWKGFGLEEKCSLPIKGEYYIKATYMCYKGGRLIETLYGTSNVITY